MWRAAVFAAFVALGAGASGCANDCKDLANEAAAVRQEAAQCSPGEECVTVLPSTTGCLGSLGCGFPASVSRANAAGERAEELLWQSEGCNPCAMVECVAPAKPTCDAATGRCVTAPPP